MQARAWQRRCQSIHRREVLVLHLHDQTVRCMLIQRHTLRLWKRSRRWSRPGGQRRQKCIKTITPDPPLYFRYCIARSPCMTRSRTSMLRSPNLVLIAILLRMAKEVMATPRNQSAEGPRIGCEFPNCSTVQRQLISTSSACNLWFVAEKQRNAHIHSRGKARENLWGCSIDSKTAWS